MSDYRMYIKCAKDGGRLLIAKSFIETGYWFHTGMIHTNMTEGEEDKVNASQIKKFNDFMDEHYHGEPQTNEDFVLEIE